MSSGLIICLQPQRAQDGGGSGWTGVLIVSRLLHPHHSSFFLVLLPVSANGCQTRGQGLQGVNTGALRGSAGKVGLGLKA
jgi:hypothetical protein